MTTPRQQADAIMTQFQGFDEIQRAYFLQESTKQLGDAFTRRGFQPLVGSKEAYDRLLNLELAATLEVTVPEPTSEFPTAPTSTPSTVRFGPFPV